MVVKQADIFGGSKEIKKKKPNKPALVIRNETIKQKIQKLYNLYEQLYELQNISILEPREVVIKNNIICYPEDRQAEPLQTRKLTLFDIDEKIRIMEKTINEWT